jgi:thioredoxin-dependent peroxiredoxin
MNRPSWLAAALIFAACDSRPSEPVDATPSASPTTPASATATAAPSAAAAFEVNAGDPAPDVEFTLHDGKTVRLGSHVGDLVFVYFYPKDDTPGCTVEAKGLRDNYSALVAAGVKVYGVSLQDATSHQAFIDKYELPFPLVVDADGAVARAFDVPVKGEYAARHSFLIGKDGKLSEVWRKVTPKDHAGEVLAAAKRGS